MNYNGMRQQQKELLMEYGTKLKDIDQNYVKDLFYPILDQVYGIMEDKVEPYTKEWDSEGAKLVNGRIVFPKGVQEVYDALIKDKNGLRLYEAFLPEEYDGVGLPPLVLGPIMETVASYDMALSVTLGLGITLIEAIGLYPTPELTGKYFPMLQDGAPGYVGFTEPVAGSNLRNLKATSVLNGDDYIVKGTKIWISNAGYADLGLVLARNMVDGKDAGTNAFIIESDFPNADGESGPGVVCSRIEEKIGIHASSTGVMELNVRVPKENLIGTVGKGYRHVLERLMGMRMGVSFQSSAVAERAYQYAKAYAQERVQFNKPIASFAAVANKLSGMENQLTKMRRLGFEAGYALSRYQQKLPVTPSYLKLDADGMAMLEQFSGIYTAGILNFAVSRAKLFNSEVGWMIVDDALQIFGGNGVAKEYNVERLLRDFRVLRIYEGTSEIQEYILDRTKGVAKANDFDTLMKIAMAQQSGEKQPEPEFKPLDYQEIFYTRFPRSKDAYVKDGGD
ncbi:MAG: acyl-CoA dehydrogenase family protein [Candidatus Thorarchaeota archaeon]